MASASKGKAKGFAPRFYDYLTGIQEEFELQSIATPAKNTRPRRYNIYLEGLKFEFELMSEDIESLRKERDEFRVKCEMQAIDIQNTRIDVVCQRCNKGSATPLQKLETASPTEFKSLRKPNIPSRVVNPSQQTLRSSSRRIPVTGSSQSISPLSPSKTSENTRSSSTPLIQSKSLSKLKTPPVVKASQRTLRLSIQRFPVTRKTEPAITPTRPSQCFPDIISGSSDAPSQSIAPPSPLLPQAPSSIVDPELDPEESKCSTTISDGVVKELGIEMAHALSHGRPIWSVKFSQDGKHLATGCADGKSYVYFVQTGTLICVLRDLLAEDDYISAVCFSRNGKYLATASSRRDIYIWDIKTKKVRNAFKGHTGWVGSLDFSPNGRLLVSASADKTVRVWNMRGGPAKVLAKDRPWFNREYYSAVFSPDGRHIAACNGDGMVRVWHVRTGQLMRRVKAHRKCVLAVGFTTDGKGLVSGDWSNFKYWDFSSWNPAFIRPSAVEEQTQPEREYCGHDDSVKCLAISPDGKWVASGSYDKTLRIWDTHSTVMQFDLEHDTWVSSVDFSPAGHYLASGGYDGMVRIWRYSHIPSDGFQLADILGQSRTSGAFVCEQLA